ncbi:MAG: hypothetical protein ACI9N3_003060 [Colwellia sp.]
MKEVQDFVRQQNLTSQILLGNDWLKQQLKIKSCPTCNITDEQQKAIVKA